MKLEFILALAVVALMLVFIFRSFWKTSDRKPWEDQGNGNDTSGGDD
jgi:hypothetical protein